ncbi:hypothetical protein [Algoriphagus aquimarinus]|uniref:Lipocalin-like domain-containing protein n=1 Tax=Algoriphagus aquimarinus TaxID=237018 RepID=A0A5C7AFU0_9BACT|nr:hypothetical protein [Algoriphagus aquimarinus]TXE05149.1 hypothetical protein ESV85_18205 [Algoriphagus aquimarinus]
MHKKLYLLIAIAFVLFSCKDNDDINPEVLTENQWQYVIENTTADPPYEYVFSIEFEPDGKVYSEAFLRDVETKEVMGHQEYFNGNFQLINGKIEVSILELYSIQVSEGLYLDKEKLSIVEGEIQSREYQLRNKNSELHTIMPIYASSLGIIYKRVD